LTKSSNIEPALDQEGNARLQVMKPYPLTVYFDGECPICRREIELMEIFNRRERLQFIDFSTSFYRPTDHGLNQCDLGRVIHARWSDGTLISGVEVFRGMWEAIGLAFLARFTRLSIINNLLIKAYAWFAKKTFMAYKKSRVKFDCFRTLHQS
jgi:predicted DCC family thiol-disulfide oxidoreductase YuxK